MKEKKIEIRCCIRCGMSEEEVKMFKIRCKPWGKLYKRHSYKTYKI